MNQVIVGQVWSVVDIDRGRFRARVERLDPPRVHMSCGRRRFTLSLSVLVHAKRGATLVEKPDGTPVNDQAIVRDMRAMKVDTEVERRSAGSLVRELQPKGLEKPIEKHARALAMQREGKSVKEIAALLGKGECAIKNWLVRARAAEHDAKYRKGA